MLKLTLAAILISSQLVLASIETNDENKCSQNQIFTSTVHNESSEFEYCTTHDASTSNSHQPNWLEEERQFIRKMQGIKACEITQYLMNESNLYESNHTVSQGEHMGISHVLNSLAYLPVYMHRYDNRHDLELSRGPRVNPEVCLAELKELNERARRATRDKSQSKDMYFGHYIDIFGRLSDGWWWGGKHYPGQYRDCVRFNMRKLDGSRMGLHYCKATLKRTTWLDWDDGLDQFKGIYIGVCLPESCDSLDYMNKYKLVERLAMFNMRSVDKDSLVLSHLYCLPHPQSPMRNWLLDGPAVVVVLVLGLWISLLIHATLKYNRLTNGKQPQQVAVDVSTKRLGRITRCKASDCLDLYRSLSITQNLKALFDGSEKKKNSGDGAQIVDLSLIEGIKVICACYVMIGHVLMIFTMLSNNDAELADISLGNFFFLLANIVPAFGVNAFFVITGMLTAYFMFKSKLADKMFRKPSLWLLMALQRYFRTMPVYLTVTAFAKYLAKYLGHGPFWDYGTSLLAQRRQCERESWWEVLLFKANFKGPKEHCLEPAWYLANDFQFLLVTPLIVALLAKQPNYGQKLLILAIIGGNLFSMLDMASSPDDLRPLATFKGAGFITFTRYIAPTYVLPYYRIPTYLIGILVGYHLYNFEQDKLKYQKLKKDGMKATAPTWSSKYKRWGPTVCACLVLLPYVVSLFSQKLMEPTKEQARWIVGFVLPALHTIFALGTAFYLLLATTGFGNKTFNSLLSLSLWKPLARLGLCVVISNVEVTNYLAQTTQSLIALDARGLYILNLVCIATTYLVGLLLYIIIEAPIRNAFNHFATARMVTKNS